MSRPLDFLVVADHAENMGTMTAVKEGSPELMTDDLVREWHKNLKDGGEEAMKPYGLTLPDEVQMVTKERAYASPIWCTP